MNDTDTMRAEEAAACRETEPVYAYTASIPSDSLAARGPRAERLTTLTGAERNAYGLSWTVYATNAPHAVAVAALQLAAVDALGNPVRIDN